MRAAPLLVALQTLLLSGCATPRVLSGQMADARFIREQATVFIESDAGLRRVSLDGTAARDVFPPGYKILDIGPDGRTFALTDRDTNLLVGDGESGEIRSIPELSRRLAAAAISPDGSRLAAVRHADFRLPQGRWKDDDAVFLIDLASLSVDTISPADEVLPTRVAWSTAGDALWLATSVGQPEWITLVDRKRTSVGAPPAPLREPPTKPSSTCLATGAKLEADSTDAVLWLAAPGRARRAIVRVGDGKKRPHEVEHDFTNLAFSPSCAHVVFVYQQRLWVTEIASGKVAGLGAGFRAFVAPSRER